MGGFVETKTPMCGVVRHVGTARISVVCCVYARNAPLRRTRAPASRSAMTEGRTSRRAVEVMGEDHLQKVLQWAGELGWNPGTQDAAPFRTADREGFFSISDDGGGAMAGAVIVCMYVKAPEHRLARILELPVRYCTVPFSLMALLI